LNTATQLQNTVTVSNIFNLIRRITIGVIAEESDSQNNIASIRNTEEEHFLHFGMIDANLFREFRTFERNNNNNNQPLRNNNNNN